MPEGPSLLHLKNKLMPFKGKLVQSAGGYGPMPTTWLRHKKLQDILTHGKHLFFVFNTGVVQVHLGLFGEMLVNERKKVNASFFLHFAKGEINGYVVKAKKLESSLQEIFDWRIDILSSKFNAAYVKSLVMQHPGETIGEVLMNQDVLAGVGNKIRNEALYRAGVHPLSIVEKMPAAKVRKVIGEVVGYARIFYNNLKKSGSNDDFRVYQQEFAADGSEVTMKVVKKTGRKLFFSEHRQQLFV